MNNFPQNSSNRKKMLERFNGTLLALISKIQHFQTVAPQTLADTETLKGGFRPTNLVKTAKGFVLFSRGGAEVLFLPAKGDVVSFFASSPLRESALAKENVVLFLTDGGRLALLNLENSSWEPKETVWPQRETDITNIALYNGKLYVVDAKNNQIYKHLPSTTGFGKGSAWLSSVNPLILNDVASFSIEGAIYLTKTSGEVWKLENGKKQEVDLGFIDPPLGRRPKIFTKNTLDKIFILAPETRRLVILDKKNNRLLTQLTAPEFDNLLDISFSEKEKKIYLLNGTKIFSVNYCSRQNSPEIH
ncbi:MAG: hypothetical protein HY982_00760, partial [Candidatus Magasanikbacteria bacterium]|nr:hypothetical protein [Candidatus Magasanikbacteria bacterium]